MPKYPTQTWLKRYLKLVELPLDSADRDIDDSDIDVNSDIDSSDTDGKSDRDGSDIDSSDRDGMYTREQKFLARFFHTKIALF